MNKKLFLLLFLSLSSFLFSQKQNIYNFEDDARQKIDSVIIQAQQQNKYVFLQIGGNWCIWCLRFNQLTQENPEIKKILENNFITYHLNYSKENKNEKILAELEFPQRFGFPVFGILNNKGEKIHTQQSDFLENDSQGYNTETVKKFLLNWSPQALNPKNYQ